MTIGVQQDAQRGGIGGELLRRITRVLFEDGAQSLSLHVLASNRAATRFYRSQGFSAKDRLRGHYLIDGHAHDGLLMRLDNPHYSGATESTFDMVGVE
jgi:ribosomal protein S18 acetylase RimI-like enzyme